MWRWQQRPGEASFRGGAFWNGANQRRGRDIPVADLFEVVLRIQQAAPGRRDQLSVDRIGRRHPSAARENGVFGASDQPMTDEMLAKAPGPSCTSPRCSAPSCPSTTSEGVSAQLKFTGPVLADIFLGKITQVERPGDCEAQSRLQGHRATSPWCTAPMARARRSSGPTTWGRSRLNGRQKVGVNSALNWPAGVGGKGNEGVAGLVRQTPGSSDTSSWSTHCRTRSATARCRIGRRVRQSRCDVGHGGRPRGDAPRCRRIFACRSRTHRARARILFRRSRGFCCSKIRRTRRRRR